MLSSDGVYFSLGKTSFHCVQFDYKNIKVTFFKFGLFLRSYNRRNERQRKITLLVGIAQVLVTACRLDKEESKSLIDQYR